MVDIQTIADPPEILQNWQIHYPSCRSCKTLSCLPDNKIRSEGNEGHEEAVDVQKNGSDTSCRTKEEAWKKRYLFYAGGLFGEKGGIGKQTPDAKRIEIIPG